VSIGCLADLESLLRIGRIVGRVLRELEEQVLAGVTTAELDRAAARALFRFGARPTPKRTYGFPGAVCLSLNEEAVHGVPGDRAIRPGDLVKIDLTADLDGYVADAARTVAVPPAAPETLRLAACARAAFERGVRNATAGRRVRDIGRAVEAEVRRQGFSVLRELCGHGVGRAIHELPQIPNFDDPGSSSVLEAGLVITVEPIIAAGGGASVQGPGGWAISTADGSLSAHFEETIVITGGEPLVLTAG
jgi:methionyl aminopeptidase